MENRETPAPMPATDMTVKLFRAMSKASWDQVRRLYLVAFAGMLADKQPEPEPYRDRTLVMLMHLEDQEAWKKIYTTVKTLTKVHGRMRAFGNNNERSQRSGAKRKGQALRIPDADQEKHRLSVATFQNHE